MTSIPHRPSPRIFESAKKPVETDRSAPRDPRYVLPVTQKNRPSDGPSVEVPKAPVVLSPPVESPVAPEGTPSFKAVGGVLRRVTISPIERGGETIGEPLIRTIMPVRGSGAEAKRRLQ